LTLEIKILIGLRKGSRERLTPYNNYRVYTGTFSQKGKNVFTRTTIDLSSVQRNTEIFIGFAFGV